MKVNSLCACGRVHYPSLLSAEDMGGVECPIEFIWRNRDRYGFDRMTVDRVVWPGVDWIRDEPDLWFPGPVERALQGLGVTSGSRYMTLSMKNRSIREHYLNRGEEVFDLVKVPLRGVPGDRSATNWRRSQDILVRIGVLWTDAEIRELPVLRTLCLFDFRSGGETSCDRDRRTRACRQQFLWMMLYGTNQDPTPLYPAIHSLYATPFFLDEDARGCVFGQLKPDGTFDLRGATERIRPALNRHNEQFRVSMDALKLSGASQMSRPRLQQAGRYL